MKTVSKYINKYIPVEYRHQYIEEFLKYSGETSIYDVFYTDDVLEMLIDLAGIPVCKQCNSVIDDEDIMCIYQYELNDIWENEEGNELCCNCMLEKHYDN